MKLWRWFVGQVARLRRSVVGVLAAGSQPQHEDDRLAAADEPAPGPPAHWVERVRRGAPGLLEPSLRRRGEPVEPPSANRVALSQTELEPEPESLEDPERGYVRTEPTVAAQRPEAPVRIPLLRQVLRRMSSRSATDRATVEASPPPATKHVPHELEPAARLVNEPADSPVAEPEASLEFDTATRRVEPEDSLPVEPDRRRRFSETSRAAAPVPPVPDGLEHSQGPPIPDKPEHPARRSEAERSPGPTEVVAFEAPVQRRTATLERAANPVPELEAGVAPPSALERAVRAPAPRPSAERLREPVFSPPSPLRASSLERESPPRRRTEPLSEIARHPWPELPPPLDQPDSEVEATVRAWEHQRRLDHEQTRL